MLVFISVYPLQNYGLNLVENWVKATNQSEKNFKNRDFPEIITHKPQGTLTQWTIEKNKPVEN